MKLDTCGRGQVDRRSHMGGWRCEYGVGRSLRYQYAHLGPFQATHMTSLNTELGSDGHHLLLRAGADHWPGTRGHMSVGMKV